MGGDITWQMSEEQSFRKEEEKGRKEEETFKQLSYADNLFKR